MRRDPSEEDGSQLQELLKLAGTGNFKQTDETHVISSICGKSNEISHKTSQYRPPEVRSGPVLLKCAQGHFFPLIFTLLSPQFCPKTDIQPLLLFNFPFHILQNKRTKIDLENYKHFLDTQTTGISLYCISLYNSSYLISVKYPFRVFQFQWDCGRQRLR